MLQPRGISVRTRRFQRNLAAELAAVLAFAATSNNDHVGLMVFTDQVELHIPPGRGGGAFVRIVREMLAFQPQGRGTDISLTLDTLNRIYEKRSIVFLVSDFQRTRVVTRGGLFMTSRRHAIAVDLNDPLELSIPDVGLLALEDAETGRTLWVDTADRTWRTSFSRGLRRMRPPSRASCAGLAWTASFWTHATITCCRSPASFGHTRAPPQAQTVAAQSTAAAQRHSGHPRRRAADSGAAKSRRGDSTLSCRLHQ